MKHVIINLNNYIMQTALKRQAIDALSENYYPLETIARFKKLSNYGAKCSWIKEILTKRILKTYIECLDVTFGGTSDEIGGKRKEMFQQNDITPRKLESFCLLNRLYLKDIIKEEKNECLMRYYKLLLSLNDGTAIFERESLQRLALKYETKIIKNFAGLECPDKDVLGKFLFVSALFSNNNYGFDRELVTQFLGICAKMTP